MARTPDEALMFKPNGIITLISDFGNRDPFVGLMKGVILSRFAEAKLVDLTHEIPAYATATAGFWLARSWCYFPSGTVHLAVVDPGVGTERGIVLLQVAGHAFLAPDNGLLDEVARSSHEANWWQVDLDQLRTMLPARVSNTFHGRDIFAPLVAEIAAARLMPKEVGARLNGRVCDRQLAAHPANFGAAKEVTGHIIAIDHFGNLITDIEVTAVQQFLNPRIHFRGQVLVLKNTYGSTAAGEMLALINSFGVVELAQSLGNAQVHYGARYGELVVVREA